MANAGFVGTHTFYLLFLPLLRWIELGQSVVIEMKQERWVDPFTSWILSVFYNDSLELDVEMKGVRMDFAYFVGRDLIILLALGVYVSGFVKVWLYSALTSNAVANRIILHILGLAIIASTTIASGKTIKQMRRRRSFRIRISIDAHDECHHHSYFYVPLSL